MQVELITAVSNQTSTLLITADCQKMKTILNSTGAQVDDFYTKQTLTPDLLILNSLYDCCRLIKNQLNKKSN